MADCYDLYRLNVAAAAMASTDSPGAIRLLRHALSVNEAHAASHRLLAVELNKAGEAAEARHHFERAAELEPKAEANWNALVAFHDARHDSAASEAALNRGLTFCPDSAVLQLARIHRLTDRRQLPEALAELRELQRRYPNVVDYHVMIAALLFQLGRGPEGLIDMQRALVLQPNHPVALLVLATNAIETGDESTSRNFIDRLRRLQGVGPEELNHLIQSYRERFNRNP